MLLGNSVLVSWSWLVVDEIMGYSSSSGNAVRRRILCDTVRLIRCALSLELQIKEH